MTPGHLSGRHSKVYTQRNNLGNVGPGTGLLDGPDDWQMGGGGRQTSGLTEYILMDGQLGGWKDKHKNRGTGGQTKRAERERGRQ